MSVKEMGDGAVLVVGILAARAGVFGRVRRHTTRLDELTGWALRS
jgi:hypothetical protein